MRATHDRFLDVVRAANLRLPGGDAMIVAAQIRIKLSERLALIATQDGYQPATLPASPDDRPTAPRNRGRKS